MPRVSGLFLFEPQVSLWSFWLVRILVVISSGSLSDHVTKRHLSFMSQISWHTWVIFDVRFHICNKFIGRLKCVAVDRWHGCWEEKCCRVVDWLFDRKWLDDRTNTMLHLIPRLVNLHYDLVVMSSSLHIMPSLHHRMTRPTSQLLFDQSFPVSGYFSGKYHIPFITCSHIPFPPCLSPIHVHKGKTTASLKPV